LFYLYYTVGFFVIVADVQVLDLYKKLSNCSGRSVDFDFEITSYFLQDAKTE